MFGYQVLITTQFISSRSPVIDYTSTNIFAFGLNDAKSKLEKYIQEKNELKGKVKVKNSMYAHKLKKGIYITEFGRSTSLLAKYIVCQLEEIVSNRQSNAPYNTPSTPYGGSKKKIHTGKRGGKYYIKNGKKVYV